MSTSAHELLGRRRDRAIAIILRMKETECDPHLNSAAKAKMRKVILDQLNAYHDVAVDIINSTCDDDVVLNDLYLKKIDEIHERVK